MDEFIKKIILRNTIHAAFQRGKVYANNVKSNDKIVITDSIKAKLEELSVSYYNNMTENQHIKNILSLSKTISEEHHAKLKGQRLRIGTAQKLLNVYVKFLWCLGEINEPIHCPIDGIVLRKIRVDCNWTELDNIDKYKEIISKLRNFIPENETIAQWEHSLWNSRAN